MVGRSPGIPNAVRAAVWSSVPSAVSPCLACSCQPCRFYCHCRNAQAQASITSGMAATVRASAWSAVCRPRRPALACSRWGRLGTAPPCTDAATPTTMAGRGCVWLHGVRILTLEGRALPRTLGASSCWLMYVRWRHNPAGRHGFTAV